MRVRVVYGLPGMAAGIEDNAISSLGDTIGQRDLVRLGRHLGQQTVPGGGEAGQVRIVRLGNYQHVNRRLRIDVAKCKRVLAFQHACRRDLTSRDSAE